MNNPKNSQKGFTILVAVVTAGILLIIAMSIGGIALKEQVLSTASRESQVAYYAADTGLECALYWDQKMGVFKPDTDPISGKVVTQTSTPTISCGGSDSEAPTLSVSELGNYTYTLMFSGIPVGNPADNVNTCAVVTVSKNTTDPNRTYTTINSYGYNTCDASLTRLERGIETQY